jgi:hypothetical protein
MCCLCLFLLVEFTADTRFHRDKHLLKVLPPAWLEFSLLRVQGNQGLACRRLAQTDAALGEFRRHLAVEYDLDATLDSTVSRVAA